MKRNAGMIFVGFLIAAIFVALQVVFIVRQGEVAVLTRLGKPVGAITDPGLYRRWPWPVERVYSYDNRTRSLEGSFEETLTHDGKNVLVGLYAGWRIDNPVKFLERVGTVEQAESKLDGLLRTFKNAAIGQFKFSNLANVDAAELRLDDIERKVLEDVKPAALERYGMNVEFVGIRRLGLPEAITQSVFERMRAERQELADRYRSEGEGEAIKIRAQADSERDKLLAQADADAKRIRADGDAAAAEYYQVFEKNPDLAMFLRKLEVLEDTLKEKATVVLNTDTEPFDLLRSSKSEIRNPK
jgi:modulator of FtsH protease HflC